MSGTAKPVSSTEYSFIKKLEPKQAVTYTSFLRPREYREFKLLPGRSYTFAWDGPVIFKYELPHRKPSEVAVKHRPHFRPGKIQLHVNYKMVCFTIISNRTPVKITITED